jgi:outer membrane protein TolC
VRRFVAAFAVVALAAPAVAQVRPLGLDEAIRMGLDHSPDMRMGQADVDKADAEEWSALGAMGPRLSIEAGIQYWDDATDVSFIDAGTMTIDPVKLQNEIGTLLPPATFPETNKLFGSLATLTGSTMRVQDRTTGSVVLQAVQPITPLYSLASLYKLSQAGREVAELAQKGTAETVRFRVSEAFFRVLSAQKMIEVAQKAVEQVEGHLKTARSFHAAGIVGKDDVLRAEAALARVKDGLNQAMSGTALARAALNVTIGLPPSEPTQPAGTYPDNPPEIKASLEECVEKALQARSEIRGVEKRVEMASAGRHAQIGQMLPTIAAVFRYSHNEGSQFQRADSWFIGGQLTWTFWEWGATYHKVKSVEADLQKATEGLGMARDGVTLDVTKAYLDLKQARSSIDMNRAAVEASEEALRVVTKKYEASTATSVEVLDGQSALTQARAAYEVALFSYYTSLANLRRAVGQEL